MSSWKYLLQSLVTIFTISTLIACGKPASIGGPKYQAPDAPQVAGSEESSFGAEEFALCKEGAFRNGEHCKFIQSENLKKICKVFTTGSGSCAGLPDSDLENTCLAGLYGQDTCAVVRDEGLKAACNAAAYGTDRHCK